MPKMHKLLVVTAGFAAAWVFAGSAAGQDNSYLVQRPGQPPVYMYPQPGGGYTINSPGRPPTYVNPRPGGGYMIQRAGQPPVYANPQSSGGYMVQTPGNVPNYLNLGPPSPGIQGTCGTTQKCNQ